MDIVRRIYPPIRPGMKLRRSIRDFTDQRFGRLVAKSIREYKGSSWIWACECDCGNACGVAAGSLYSGNTKSCGCFGKEAYRESENKSATHRMSKTPEYRAWLGMKTRCSNENSLYYGKRGITVCQEWVESFESFFAYIGSRPSNVHSVERMNTDGNYEPGNVKWATAEEQKNNCRNNVILTAFGETMTVPRWSKRKGIPSSLIRTRIKRGWSPEDAISQPKYRGGRQ